MQKTIVIASLVSLSLSASAADFSDQAQVVSVEPLVQTGQQCAQHGQMQQQRAGGQDLGGTVLGGIAGAAIGSQIGKGKGNTAATALGTVVGAAVGNNMAQGGSGQPVYSGGCQHVQQITGHRVTYVYNGRQITEQWGPLAPQPGQMINVHVNVRPQ